MDTQFKKGVLDLCVLSLINQNEMYGYGLKVEMSKIMDVNENTLYPLLRRLEKDELLTTYLKESDEGRSRKYYAITLKGKDYLQKRIQDWYEFTEVVNHILKGGNKDE